MLECETGHAVGNGWFRDEESTQLSSNSSWSSELTCHRVLAVSRIVPQFGERVLPRQRRAALPKQLNCRWDDSFPINDAPLPDNSIIICLLDAAEHGPPRLPAKCKDDAEFDRPARASISGSAERDSTASLRNRECYLPATLRALFRIFHYSFRNWTFGALH